MNAKVPRRQTTPRARRFPIQTPFEYRPSGDPEWLTGETVNISRSGVLFRAGKKLEPETMLEMHIVFPGEITGGDPVNVHCWGPVVRSDRLHGSESVPALAAAIVKYRFARE